MLTKVEKETIITYNEAEPTADVFTYNKALIRKLEKLCAEYPQEFKNIVNTGDESKSFVVPKKYVKVTAPRKFNGKTREKMVEMAKRLNERKAGE